MMRLVNTTVFPKKYWGAPTAVILKAALAAFQPFTEDRALGIGIQHSIRSELFTLLSLYGRGEPSGLVTEPSVPSPLTITDDRGETAISASPCNSRVAANAMTMQGIAFVGTADQTFGRSYYD